MNIECNSEVLEEITTLFRYNDAVLRNLVIKCKEAVTEESLILKSDRESKERRARMDQKRKMEEDAAEAAAASRAAAEAAAAEETAASESDATDGAADEEAAVEDGDAVVEESTAGRSPCNH